MRIEWIILCIVWIVTAGLLFTIPKNKRRVALVAFLFKQAITWVIGLAVVQYGFITYPVRLFAEVNHASFTYEFFVYPAICGIFNAFYPNSKSAIYKIVYYSMYCTVLTIPEVWLEKHTELIKYKHWNGYVTWISLFITFFMSRWFCKWFFRGLLWK
ncbi:CBO0543 family protein [Marinicrinis lubricantis]|uniref:CBO0543 family protein n=1 Tax=Marinicrinis lubricantis TaxID=2086470 RepID=A0ABW1IN65_9BACL